MTTFTIGIIALALIFDYINGFHDAANSIATVVSTKVLTPFQAVLWAAMFNFIAFFVFNDHNVANTIAKIVHRDYITHQVIFSGLIAGILWNVLTWKFGIPSSSSHALIGGFAGAALAHSLTFQSIELAKIIKVIAFIFLAPLTGILLGLGISLFIGLRNFWVKFVIITMSIALLFYLFLPSFHWCLGISTAAIIFTLMEAQVYFGKSNYAAYNVMYKRLQLLSSAAFSLGHGGNDAQKVMGIIIATLAIDNPVQDTMGMPAWVPVACYAAMGIGTLSGGWRIVKTMGGKITKVSSFEGVSAETAGAITLFSTEAFGIPVSTTHTITGSIMGVGLAKRVSAVRWGITISLLWAWVVTIPLTAVCAALVYFVCKLILV